MPEAILNPSSPAGVWRAGLWFGLIGGGIGWLVHLLSAYAIAEFGCVGGHGESAGRAISRVAWMELIATAVTAGLAAIATIIAYRCDRQLQSRDEATLVGEKATARAGLLASGFFTFVILFESIPIFFYLRDC